MASLKSQHILQIDATVITGLLILLTIQSTSEPPIGLTYLEEVEKLQDAKDVQVQTYLTVINKLNEMLVETNPLDYDRMQLIKTKINEYEIKYYEAHYEYLQLGSLRDHVIKTKPLVNHGFTDQQITQTLAVAMMIPFAFSAMWETISTFERKKEIQTDIATMGSKIGMILGFFGLVLGLYLINQLTIN